MEHPVKRGGTIPPDSYREDIVYFKALRKIHCKWKLCAPI